MNLEDAQQLLGVTAGSSEAERHAAYEATRSALEGKLAKAPTAGLKEKYRKSLGQLDEAIEAIENSVDGGELPTLTAQPSHAPVPPQAPPPAHAPHAAAARPAVPSTPSRKGKEGEIMLAVVVLAIVAGGAWWYMQSNASSGVATVGEDWVIPDIELAMTWVEPGTFQMGVPWYVKSERPPQLDEREYKRQFVEWVSDPKPGTSQHWARYRALISQRAPDHRVTISKGYWIGTLEVTQGEWKTIMGSNPSSGKGGDDHPVENVSWNEAMSFCAKLNEIEHSLGRLPPNYRYTLPTEAEWEYAAVAGGSHTLSIAETQAQSWNLRNSGNRAHPCGEKNSNDWGIHDMSGNVSEWCKDWIGPYATGTSVDPTGPRSGDLKVFRGGSYIGMKEMSRFLFKRESLGPLVKKPHIGFRIALTYKEAKDPKAVPDPR